MLKYILILLLAFGIYAKEPEHKHHRGERPHPTEKQKQVRANILKKYDTNKDGRLSPEEREKISEADRKKIKDAGLPPRRPHHREHRKH